MNKLIILSTQAVPEGRVFGLDAQTLIQIGFQLFNGIVLAAVLTYLLYKPVKEFMEKRSDRIQNSRDEAEETMAKATALIAEYETKITEIEKERTEILEAARVEANDQRKVILKEAVQEADKLKQQSLAKIAGDKERLKEESRLHIIELSSVIAGKYLAENLDDKAQADYFEDMIAQLEESTWIS